MEYERCEITVSILKLTMYDLASEKNVENLIIFDHEVMNVCMKVTGLILMDQPEHVYRVQRNPVTSQHQLCIRYSLPHHNRLSTHYHGTASDHTVRHTCNPS